MEIACTLQIFLGNCKLISKLNQLVLEELLHLWITFTGNNGFRIDVIIAYSTYLEIINGRDDVDAQGAKDIEGQYILVF